VLVGAIVACVLGGASTDAAAVAAPAPCWQRLIADWSDGHVDGRYPVSCYQRAIADEPTDLRIYSTLDDDLHAAIRTLIATLATDHAHRRTLALERPTQAAVLSSTQTRLAALLALVGGICAAALLGVALVHRRNHTKTWRHRP
jgi:hypothetical protein